MAGRWAIMTGLMSCCDLHACVGAECQRQIGHVAGGLVPGGKRGPSRSSCGVAGCRASRTVEMESRPFEDERRGV